MVRKHTKLFGLLPLVTVLAFIMITGCAVKTTPNPWGDPATGLILTYRMADNQTLKYESTSTEDQTLEMMNQSMVTKTATNYTTSVSSKGIKENNLALGITLDAMKVDIKSFQGNFTPDLAPVLGKSFDMTLSPLGKELEITGAETLKYNIGPQEHRVATSFRTFFPDLPDKPVKVGDSWPGSEELTEKTENMEFQVSITNTNTVEALETVDGMDCVKIKTIGSGTMNGKGKSMGQDLTFEGTVKGTTYWYFAYKEGTFVKQTGENSSEATIKVSSGMSIPMSTIGKSEVKLVK